MTIDEKYKIRKLLIGQGVCPFDEWFKLLSNEYKYIVETRLLRLRLGSFGEINNVGGGVWELKFRKGSAHRIYYSLIGKQIILLIVGGDKNLSQKI